jgi:molybdate transport system substrate-binding protein
MRKRSFTAAATIGVFMLLAQGAFTEAAEIKVIAGAAMSGVMRELGPQFERATGHKLVIQYGVTGGMKRQIESGEAFDLAIVPAGLLDDVAKQGKIAPGTRTEISRVGMGVGVRAGTPKPDIGSTDAFKRALLNAKAVAYIPEGVTGIHLEKVFARLGIAEQMKAKTKPQKAVEGISQAVANGEAEFGFALANLFLSGRGVELGGLFPPELQSWVVNTAGVGAAAKQPDAAKALIKHLTTPAAAAVIKAKGMEPVAR